MPHSASENVVTTDDSPKAPNLEHEELGRLLAVLAEVRRTSEAEVEARDGPFITSRQAWIISMLVIGWIANGGASLFKISLLNYVAIVLLSVGLVAFIVTALPGIRRAPGYFKGLEDETMGDVGRNLTRWYRTVRQIRQGYWSGPTYLRTQGLS